MNPIRFAIGVIVALWLTIAAGQTPGNTTAQGTSSKANSSSKKSRKKALKSEANSQGAASSPTALPAKPGAPPSTTLKPAPPVPAKTASAAEIQAARARGDVWVNTATRTYHKAGKWYGTTKTGKFMSEPDAVKAGYRPAKNEATQ